MKSKLLHEASGQKTFVLIFETGDEVMSQLEAFAKEQRLDSSSFRAIGAFQDVVLGYFDWQKKDYLRIPIKEQVEVVSLLGDIALCEERPAEGACPRRTRQVRRDRPGRALAGGACASHLELVLTESPSQLRRKHDPTTGLALINS